MCLFYCLDILLTIHDIVKQYRENIIKIWMGPDLCALVTKTDIVEVIFLCNNLIYIIS